MENMIVSNGEPAFKQSDFPVIPYIEGDGIGPDIWSATQMVLDKGVDAAYGKNKKIQFMEIYAGQKAHKRTGQWLPQETLYALKQYKISIKGAFDPPLGRGGNQPSTLPLATGP